MIPLLMFWLLLSIFLFSDHVGFLSRAQTLAAIFTAVFFFVLYLDGIPDYVEYEKIFLDTSFQGLAYPYFDLPGQTGRETGFGILVSALNGFIEFPVFYALYSATLAWTMLFTISGIVNRRDFAISALFFLSLFSL